MKRTTSYISVTASILLAWLADSGICADAVRVKSDQLNAAIGLIAEHKPAQARQIITNIAPNAPDYALAQYYDAIALHDLNDRLGFLKKLEGLKTNNVVLAAEVHRALAVKEMDVLLYYRRFEDLLPKARTNAKELADVSEGSVAADFLLATLYERGMKKTEEACRAKDEAVFNNRWPEGKANLEEFLKLAATRTNYATLSSRQLQQEVLVARIALGESDAVLREIPASDSAAREKASYLRVQLFQKLQREKTEQNLGLIKDFLKTFPETKHRKRLEFDLATLTFRLGEQAARQAQIAEQGGSPEVAAQQLARAREFFIAQRALQQEQPDKASGIEPSDLMEMRADLLYGYVLEKNYQEVSRRTQAMIATSSAGEVAWLIGKVYYGVALLNQATPDHDQAIKVLDEVLALGFKNKPEHDYYILLAVKWRIHAALVSNNPAKVRELVAWVKEGSCRKDMKAKFLKENEGLDVLLQSSQAK